MALDDGNFARRVSETAQIICTLMIILLVCDRIQNTSQQQVTSSTGFNANADHDEDVAEQAGGNELSRQLDLPAKQLIEDGKEVNAAAGVQQTRSDWLVRPEMKYRRENPLQGDSKMDANEFISVLNNQSNIVTNPLQISRLSSNLTTRSKLPSARFEADPHLREELDFDAQNATRSINHGVNLASSHEKPEPQLNRTTLGVDLNNRTLSEEAQPRQVIEGGERLRKKKKKKKRKRKLPQSIDDQLLLLNLLPFLNPENDRHHRLRHEERNGRQHEALIGYLNVPREGGSIKGRTQPATQQPQPQPQVQVGEPMVMSSSQPSNEFETTMITRPAPNQEPIVAGSDVSGLGADSSGYSSMRASANLDDNDDDVDDDDDDDVDDKGIGTEQNPSSSLASKTGQQRSGDPTASSAAGNSSSRLVEASSIEMSTSSTKSPIVVAEQELLVGPFRSEAEAPATITLSGVIYQKSGARAPASSPAGTGSDGPLRWSSGAGAGISSAIEGEKLSTSDSASHLLSSSGSGGLMSNQQKMQQQPGLFGLDGLAASGQHIKASPFEATSKFADGAPRFVGLNSNGKGNNINNISNSNKLRFSGLEEPRKGPLEFGGARVAAVNFPRQQLLPNHYYAGQQQQLVDPLAVSTSASSSAFSSVASSNAADELKPQTGGGGGGDEPATGSWLLLDNLDSAASGAKLSSSKGTKQQPVVIVQKDVKPVKYHLIRAYLKLRRLLRPYEATYVFMN